MAEGAFVEGDQAPRDKDEEHERVPSRLVEEHGDDAQLTAAEPAMQLQRLSDVALDEGIMVGELLKKGRLKNPTLTDRKPLLLDDKNLSVLLEATQNITLRYHLLGTIQDPETPPPAKVALPASPRALSSSDEMLYFKEKVRNAPGPILERRGASCSRLQLGAGRTSGAISATEKPILPSVAAKCALAPAYSPSQLDVGRVKSQIAGLTLKKSSLLRAGDGEQACRKLSKLTQIVIGSANAKTQHSAQQRPQQADFLAPGERDPNGIRDLPLLEVLDRCDLEPVPAAERVRRRVRRYYRADVSCSGSSEGASSLVQLDLSTLLTDASELPHERAVQSATLSPHESSTSWYSFDSDPSSSRMVPAQRDSASGSEASWAAARRDPSPILETAAECCKASSLIRYFESIRPRAP
ncbi:hypothetical protein V5799_025360 [Amblyomma americanum]|uniref:Uncharacterized protein n=1 Tax=Amblyomma americanum TaxID=6943 RepID=A0AAQ4E9P0_AMBAM